MLVYPWRMRLVWPLLLILVTGDASSQVYRWIDSEGRTHYSDRPESDAQALRIDGSGRSKEPASTAQAVPEGSSSGPYASFEIAAPQDNQTLRTETPNVPFSLLLDPPLMKGHRLEIVLDGASIAVDPSVGTQVSLKGLAYGSHVAEAQIRNRDDVVIARTASINFHLRKPLPPGVIQ